MSLFNIPTAEQEQWRAVKGYEGYYEVSNLGRVRSLERQIENRRGTVPAVNKKAQGTTYMSVVLYKDGSSSNKLVHRLVAEAFLPNPDNLPEVNHKDNNPKNNRYDNLEWVTSAQNSEHRLKTKQDYSYRKSVKCLETGEVFSSLSAAGRSVEASTQQVIDSINSKRCCKGVTFAYTDNLPENIEEYIQQAHAKYESFHRRPKMPNARKVQCEETGQVFDSIAAAARFYNCDTATVNNRIKANKPVNGVTLRYVE